MKQNQKRKLLRDALRGQMATLRQAKQNRLTLPTTGAQWRALSDESLLYLVHSGVTVDPSQLSTPQLRLVINTLSKAQGRDMIDVVLMSSDELRRRIAELKTQLLICA